MNKTGDLNSVRDASPADQPAPATRRPRFRNRFRWLMVVIWAGFIFYLSTSGFGPSFTQWLLIQILALLHVTVSPATFELLHYGMRKLAHMTEYCILSLLIYASLLDAEDFEWRPRLALGSVVLAGLYSLTDEYHQSFVSNRTSSLIDCGIDTAGAAIAAVMVWAWDRVRQTIRRSRAATTASTAETSKGAAGV